MDPIEKRELKRKAWMRLAAQRRRAGLLRGRVLALSLICFVALWAIVFVQMATGNDPVPAGKERTVTARVASPDTRREVETTDPREARSRGESDEENRPGREEEATVEAEPTAEEAESEPEAAAPELEAAEPEFVEEPLVTSQS
jgi:hypothetical protein